MARPWACPCDPTLCCWCRAGDKTEQDLGRELLEPLQKKARTLPELWALKLQRQEAQQTVRLVQQTYWAQLHEAQQKVQEADNESIANKDRRSTTRVGDMTDEDLGHELVLHQLLARHARVGTRQVALVDRDHDGDLSGLGVVDRLDGLRHDAVVRGHDEHDDVGHLGAAGTHGGKRGVAGRVDDVDAHILPDDRRGLGKDGDATFLLKLIRIHDSFDNALVLAESAGLFEQFIDERGFPMVDMGYDCDVSYIVTHKLWLLYIFNLILKLKKTHDWLD